MGSRKFLDDSGLHLDQPCANCSVLIPVTTERAANEIIRQAHLEHGYRLAEIGSLLGLHYSTISRLVNSQER